MDLRLNEDQRLIVDMVRAFSTKEVAPTAAHRDQTGEFPLALFGQMAELGLIGMAVPENYGGSETGAVAYAHALYEIARGDCGVGTTMSVSNMVAEIVYKFGTEQQRRQFLPALCAGDYPIGAFALTESSSGSDAGSLKTRAVPDGDEYVINGSKMFITSGAYASVIIVMARTEDVPGPKGVSAFVVTKDTPGMSVGKEEEKMGLRSSNTVELNFEDCRVPAANLLGKRGEGFKVAMTALDSGRIGISCQACGTARAALDLATDYAKERIQFGKPICELQAIQWKLADMATWLEASWLLTLQAASMKDRGVSFTKQASMAKLYSTEAANRIVREAVQVHGGYGYVKEYPVERLFRDCRVTTLYEGTSEVQHIVISRKLLED